MSGVRAGDYSKDMLDRVTVLFSGHLKTVLSLFRRFNSPHAIFQLKTSSIFISLITLQSLKTWNSRKTALVPRFILYVEVVIDTGLRDVGPIDPPPVLA